MSSVFVSTLSRGSLVRYKHNLPKHSSGWEGLLDLGRHTDVCQQHELLDQAVGLPLLLLLDIDRLGALGRVEMDLELGRRERQCSRSDTAFLELDGHGVEQSNRRGQGVVAGSRLSAEPFHGRAKVSRVRKHDLLVIFAILGSLVCEGLLGRNDRFVESHIDNLGLGCQFLGGQLGMFAP